MKLLFFTDPHLGLERNSHTTPASRGRLKQEVFNQLDNVFDIQADFYICAGDLFDKHTVDNQTLLQGLEVAKLCDVVLSGNHDSTNRVNALSSMEVIKTVLDTEAIGVLPVNSQVNIVWVNHELNQDLFLEALETAKHEATKNSILVLHCNYDSPFAHDDASLNLTRDKAKELLEHFSYVVLGHEHQHRTDFDGRLFILGNTHPTSFADISDKFCWEFSFDQPSPSNIEGESWSIKPHLIWSKDNGLLELDASELAQITKLPKAVQFIEVTGKVTRDKVAGVAKQVADLWSKSENLLMVRNNTTCEQEVVEAPTAPKDIKDIPTQVSKALAGTELEILWNNYLEAL